MKTFSQFSNQRIIETLGLNLISRIHSSNAEVVRSLDRIILVSSNTEYDDAKSISNFRNQIELLLDRSPYWIEDLPEEEDVDLIICETNEVLEQLHD